MESFNFKMKVTPEQSKILQKFLIENNCVWQGGWNIVSCTSQPYIYVRNNKISVSGVNSEIYEKDEFKYFISVDLPQLTFQEFIHKYSILSNKWCVQVRVDNIETLNKYRKSLKMNELFLSDYEFKFMDYRGLIVQEVNPFTEISTNLFKELVLNEKKGFIGYKLKKECEEYSHVAAKLCGTQGENSKILGLVTHQSDINKLNKAGVLELWFDPIYEGDEKILYFGKVKFTIKPDKLYAETEYGNIDKFEIKKAIDYIENPPSLIGYQLTIFKDDKYTRSSSLNIIGLSIGFGCEKGTLKELKDIYNAFNN